MCDKTSQVNIWMSSLINQVDSAVGVVIYMGDKEAGEDMVQIGGIKICADQSADFTFNIICNTIFFFGLIETIETIVSITQSLWRK